jgi:hypothetical protein
MLSSMRPAIDMTGAPLSRPLDEQHGPYTLRQLHQHVNVT